MWLAKDLSRAASQSERGEAKADVGIGRKQLAARRVDGVLRLLSE